MKGSKIYILKTHKHEPNSKEQARYFGSEERRSIACNKLFRDNTLSIIDQIPGQNNTMVNAKDYTNTLWTVTLSTLTLE